MLLGVIASYWLPDCRDDDVVQRTMTRLQKRVTGPRQIEVYTKEKAAMAAPMYGVVS